MRTEDTGFLATVASLQTFQALRYRDYRLLWMGQVMQGLSHWMENIARNWLIWQLTGSGVYLGLNNLFRAVPILLFGVLAGAVADRVDKRKILILAQAGVMANELVLGSLEEGRSGRHVELGAGLAAASRTPVT